MLSKGTLVLSVDQWKKNPNMSFDIQLSSLYVGPV